MVGLTVESIYALFHLCSDLVFCILFPQLVGAVHISFVNTYGSIAAYIIGLFLRLTGGEELIGFPALFKYPGYKNNSQNFPFRTLGMVISFIVLLLVSQLTNYLFDSGMVDESRDFLGVIERRKKLEEKVRNRESQKEKCDIPMSERYTPYLASEKKV